MTPNFTPSTCCCERILFLRKDFFKTTDTNKYIACENSGLSSLLARKGSCIRSFLYHTRGIVPVTYLQFSPCFNISFCSKVCKAVKSGQYPFVMCNFAPPDMVGHTGKYEPAIKGCEATGEFFSLVSDLFARRSIRPAAVLSVFCRFARCVFVVLQAWGKGLSVNTATALVESKLNYKITSQISMLILFLSVICHRANRL